MKSAVAFCVCFVAALALARPGGDHYNDQYDHMDLDEIMGNHKLITAYVNCLLEKGNCTPDGKELRDNIQDAIENDCAKCTDAQKKGSEKVMKHLKENEKEYWTQLLTKYDPDKKYITRHEKKQSGTY